MKIKRKALWSLIAIGIVLGGYLLIRKYLLGDEDPMASSNGSSGGTAAGSNGGSTSNTAPGLFPIQKGSKGTGVSVWQDTLYTALYQNLSPRPDRQKYVDGKFGPNTHADTLKILKSGSVREKDNQIVRYIIEEGKKSGLSYSEQLAKKGSLYAFFHGLRMPAGNSAGKTNQKPSESSGEGRSMFGFLLASI